MLLLHDIRRLGSGARVCDDLTVSVPLGLAPSLHLATQTCPSGKRCVHVTTAGLPSRSSDARRKRQRR